MALRLSTQLLLLGMIMPGLVFARWVYVGQFDTDFAVFWRAGHLFRSGDWGAIYQTTGRYNFPYPPHALLLFAPFAMLPYWWALAAWNFIGALFFMWAARPYGAVAVLTPGALMCLYYGQTGLIVGALWLTAFRGNWPAVAALTFKPHLGFLTALSLKSWQHAGLVTLLALVLALPFLPLWPDFFRHTIGHGSMMASDHHWYFIGVSPALAYGLAGWVPFAAAAGLLVARNFNVFTAATAALIMSPYSFSYDMPVACLGIFLAARDRWDELGPLDRLGLALGFLCPSIARLGIWWVPPLLLWCLWVQVRIAEKQPLEPCRTS